MPKGKKDPTDVGRGLLDSHKIDLGIFAGDVTSYKVTDSAGVVREFEVPDDAPFHIGQTFLLRWDENWNAQFRLTAAVSKSAEASHEKLRASVVETWELLIHAFADLVRVRTPGATDEDLGTNFGANVLMQWINTVKIRMLHGRSTLSVDDYLELLLAQTRDRLEGAGEVPKVPANRAQRRAATKKRPRSSKSSAR